MSDQASDITAVCTNRPTHAKIQLVDHTTDVSQAAADSTESEPFSSSCKVTNPVLNGSLTRGGYVNYLCTLHLNDGTVHGIRKRYSECLALRLLVRQAKPNVYIPHLPPKSYTQRAGPQFVESRRAGIELFLRSVVLNPETGGLPCVREWFHVPQHTIQSENGSRHDATNEEANSSAS